MPTRWVCLSFQDLKGSWNDFLLSSSTPDFFRSWEWVDCWLKVYGRGREPYVLAMYDGERIVGLAPLILAPWIGLKRVMFLGSGVSDRHGFIVMPGYEKAFALGLIPALSQFTPWQYCDLQELPVDDPVAAWLMESANLKTLGTAHREPQSALPYLSLPSSWEEFLVRYPKKRRDKVKYYPRLLDRDFSWKVERVQGENLAARMAHFADLNVRRWLRKGIPSSFLEPSFRRFHLQVAQAGLTSYLRFYVLTLDEKPAAYLYGFSFGGRFSFYLCAQDDRYAKYGLGFVLQVHAIRSAIEEGCRIFDFLKGLEAYKLHWKPELAYSQRLLLQRGGWGSRIGGKLTWTEHAVVQQIKRKAKRI